MWQRWTTAASLLLSLLVLGSGLLGRAPANASQGTRDNAAWLGVEWVMQPVDPEQVAMLAQQLQARRITTIYVYTTYLKVDGQWNPTYDHAAAFLERMAVFAPACSVQAWIGLPLVQRTPLTVAGYVELSDPVTRRQVAELAAHLVQDLAFDGVHLDPETVNSGDDDLLLLLDETRALLGPHVTLSLSTRRICPVRDRRIESVLGRWAWSGDYYRAVAARVDEIALMTYDSGLLLPGHYRRWTRRQTVRLTQELAEGNVRVFVGVPTSEEHTATHHPWAENMCSGLSGVLDALARGERQAVTGVAIYPYWETDVDEWALYRQLWLGE